MCMVLRFNILNRMNPRPIRARQNSTGLLESNLIAIAANVRRGNRTSSIVPGRKISKARLSTNPST